ncbi:hypothetical protein BCEN4_1330014 [Burkholderia cenocepacia]|nr:hypothetical protein BCEN4_1330014 [Burkholderia cenocepacia]
MSSRKQDARTALIPEIFKETATCSMSRARRTRVTAPRRLARGRWPSVARRHAHDDVAAPPRVDRSRARRAGRARGAGAGAREAAHGADLQRLWRAVPAAARDGEAAALRAARGASRRARRRGRMGAARRRQFRQRRDDGRHARFRGRRRAGFHRAVGAGARHSERRGDRHQRAVDHVAVAEREPRGPRIAARLHAVRPDRGAGHPHVAVGGRAADGREPATRPDAFRAARFDHREPAASAGDAGADPPRERRDRALHVAAVLDARIAAAGHPSRGELGRRARPDDARRRVRAEAARRCGAGARRRVSRRARRSEPPDRAGPACGGGALCGVVGRRRVARRRDADARRARHALLRAAEPADGLRRIPVPGRHDQGEAARVARDVRADARRLPVGLSYARRDPVPFIEPPGAGAFVTRGADSTDMQSIHPRSLK